MPRDSTIDSLVEAMTRFASTTRNDRLSVEVARVAQRVRHQGEPFEQPLTARERAVVRPFLARVEAA